MSNIKEIIVEMQRKDDFYTDQNIHKQLKGLLEEIGKELDMQQLYYITFEDIKMYDVLQDYTPTFTLTYIPQSYIPFLKEHHPVTLRFLDLTVVFYMLVLYEALSEHILEVDDKLRDFLRSDECLVLYSNSYQFWWDLLKRILNLKDTDERSIFFSNYEFYVDDKMYQLIEKKIIENYYGSPFERAMECILGCYRMRFSIVKYIREYQPLFMRVAYDYMLYKDFPMYDKKIGENILPKNSSGIYIGKPELPVSQKTRKRDLEKDKKENAVILGQAGDGKCGTYGIEKEKE